MEESIRNTIDRLKLIKERLSNQRFANLDQLSNIESTLSFIDVQTGKLKDELVCLQSNKLVDVCDIQPMLPGCLKSKDEPGYVSWSDIFDEDELDHLINENNDYFASTGIKFSWIRLCGSDISSVMR